MNRETKRNPTQREEGGRTTRREGGKRGDRIAVKKKTGTDTDTEDEKKFVSGSATKRVYFFCRIVERRLTVLANSNNGRRVGRQERRRRRGERGGNFRH